MTPLRWVAVGLAALPLLMLAFITWMLGTESGAQFVANVAQRVMAGKLEIGSVQGTITGPLTVGGVRYYDPLGGVDVRVERASVNLNITALMSRVVQVRDASVNGVVVLLSESKKPEEPKKPFTLEPPIDIIVDRFVLQSAKVSRDGKLLFEANSAALIGSWTANGVGIRQLEVISPQGRVDIKGAVDKENAYVGRADGHVRWRLGQFEYVAALTLNSNPADVTLNVEMSSPVKASVAATMKQERSAPWTLNLRVPVFDPREKLLPGSSLETLAVALRGQGDRERAEVRGEVAVDGARVFIDPLRVSLDEQVVKIEALTLRDAQRRGVLDVDGLVRLDREPFYADVIARWRDVEVPAQLAGQKLASLGELKVRGNPSEFDVNGDLKIGPPNRMADIRLIAQGTPQQVRLEQLSIMQKDGHLTANGTVDLKPRIAWKIGAEAQSFDPGALLADWPGRLGFKLNSEGQLVEAGPQATLQLDGLQGTLRNRQIAGNADLTLTSNRAVSGTMNVSSGRSSVRVRGAGGETLDLVADFDVASLDDWMPAASGQVNGQVTAKGRWPQIKVAGDVRGRGLGLEEMSLRTLDLNFDVTEPLHPSGSLTANARGLLASGFELTTIDLRVNGSERNHTLELRASGDPVGADLRVQGQRLENGWSGAIQSLTLAVQNMEHLVLQQPAQVSMIGQAVSLSDSCLRSSQFGICVAGQRSAANELQGRYSIEHLPLALITTLAQPDLQLAVRGALDGKGDVRRTADGALFGDATLTSSSGSVAELGSESDPLLNYENFEMVADLNGDTARATARMAFNNGGTVQGEATLANLRGAAPTVDGRGSLKIADLSLIGLFVPQLANVSGRAEGDVTVNGTVTDPNIMGTARVRELSTELPMLGLQLRNGELDASASGTENIRLSGHIQSGDGQLTIDGSGESIDALQLNLTGKDFTAANIPAAQVVIAPELNFTKQAERMELMGKVTVTRAQVDLTKLPRGGGGQSVSPDVVVIDDPVKEQRAKAMQLITEIQVIFGDVQRNQVKLAGFGLDAKLGGQLLVKESPGSEPLGAGELTLDGTYKAYGQDLTIERGRLLYANTPLTNPQLDIVAFREIEGTETVTARLIVRGSAQSPMLEVTTDPPLPQTQALAYLVTGKPMDQIGSGEGDIVQSAARSLGGAAGNLIAKNFGRRLGIDEIGIENSTEIGGSAFTVGQYLSPRLYLSYGVGLFEPGQVVTLRYRLSRSVNIEASQGPESQRAGINYRIEK